MRYTLKIIHLPHRTDRRQQISDDCQALLGLRLGDEHFHPAHHDPANGALGCAISHHAVLSAFLEQDTADHLLVFEDDLSFKAQLDLPQLLLNLSSIRPAFDVFLFAHNKAFPVEQIPGTRYYRVLNAQTASGYVVSRAFAPQLQRSFHRSIHYLRQYQHLPAPYDQFVKHTFAIDMLWKELQIEGRFITSSPPLACQRSGFSDIEQEHVDYGA